jgi:hypothetical protein
MSNLKRWFLITITSGLVGLLLLGLLMIAPVLAQGPGGMMGRGGGMGGYGYNNAQPGGYGPGWMTLAPGRGADVGNTQGYTATVPYGFGPGRMHGGIGRGGMMGSFGPGWGYQGEEDSGFYGYGCARMGGGMMWNNSSPFFQTEALSLSEASEAVNTFLTNLNDSNLELGEVMIFDNHAYAQIIEKDSGIGALEVLVDPATKAVYPEMGPNMMWNLKYGMMAGYGGYGMMGRFGYNLPGQAAPGEVSAEMPVTSARAVEAAEAYLDAYVDSNLDADEHADPFYGYYTLHVNRAGETIGMLSVNGYTEQVFLHTWHGNLLEMSGE